MCDPEAADFFIRMAKCKTVFGQRMREQRRIKIKSQTLRLCPIDPLAEMTGLELIEIDLFIGIRIYRM
ncbi:hypothetical protein D3C77_625360 [compost metagenome]